MMEGSEGGRNMIKETLGNRNKGRISELKIAVNIWRERVPSMCESITHWQEVLENRRFIQEQIGLIYVPNLQPQ
jgi:hypothetical protein